MVVELRQNFQLTAEQFSSLGSIYLLAYSLLQIPLGFILDILGVRRVITIAILICISGTCLFALATDLWMLQLGRFLIGLGSAPAFICALKLVRDHLPQKYAGLLMGVTLSIGTIGAVISGKLLVILLEMTRWQNALYLSAGLGALLLIAVLTVVPKDVSKTPVHRMNWDQFRQGFKSVFQHREIVLYSLIAIGLFTPLCVLADLWGTALIMEKFTLGRAQAASLSMYLYGGLTLGSLILPWLSLKWRISKRVIQVCAIGLILCLCTLLYANGLMIWQLALLLTIIGILCGAEMICFAAATQDCASSYSGLALGVVNTLNMLGGGLVQQIIGWSLDWQWTGTYSLDGARYYGAHELALSFSLLIIIIASCCLLTLKLPNLKAKSGAPSPDNDTTSSVTYG